MVILNISKTVLYDFNCDNMMQKCAPNKIKLLYTDTDSLIYEVECEYVYEEVIKADLDKFDTSDYPSDNLYGIELKNRKQIGVMKDETKGRIMSEYAGLRSKQYANLVEKQLFPNSSKSD